MRPTQHWTRSETELLDYVAGDLDPNSCARYEAHLEDCADCRAKVAAELESLEEVPPIADATRQRMAAEFEELLLVRDRPLRVRRRQPFYLLAAALALSVLVSFAILRQRGGGLDDASLALLARADQELPETLSPPLWTPVGARSLQPSPEAAATPGRSELTALLADLEASQSIRPDHDELRLALAHAQTAAGQTLAAEGNYRALLGATDLADRARIGLAAALHSRGLFAEAMDLLREIPDGTPQEPAALFDRALLHLALGQNREAEQLAQRYERRFGDDAWCRDLKDRLARSEL